MTGLIKPIFIIFSNNFTLHILSWRDKRVRCCHLQLLQVKSRFSKVHTAIFQSGHHHPCPDPRLRGQRWGHASPFHLLRVWLNQLSEASTHESGVLPSEGRQRVYGSWVHSDETHLMQSSESWLGQVEEMGFGKDPWRGKRWVWMKGGWLWAAGRRRTLIRAPAVKQSRRRTVVVRPLFYAMRQKCINAKVLGFLNLGSHSDPKRTL